MTKGNDGKSLHLPSFDKQFLKERMAESREVILEISQKSKLPLFIQFSGGNDSLAMLGLVKDVTDNFVCTYMATGLEFKGVIPFVKNTCKTLGVELLISNPSMHKGNLFKRIEKFNSFPGLIATWCCRDLKLRPQRKMLQSLYGKENVFYKLEGIRLSESIRRRYIYKDYTSNPIREDSEFIGSYEVFPIINWTDDDVENYLNLKGLSSMLHYKKYGVSGCSFCPFYGPEIYRRIYKIHPNLPLYNRVIYWENILEQPSVSGYYFLRDIKREFSDPDFIASPQLADFKSFKSPCTTMYEGKLVNTCDIFGHTYIDGVCFRCEHEE